MAFRPLKHNSKVLRPHKSLIGPDFNHRTILVRNYGDYVEMWLRREGHDKDAIQFWNQARNFYKASINIPNTAAPLTLYYSFLNAAKTLLEVNGKPYAERHGASGALLAGQTNLKNEMIKFHPNGVL